MQATDIVGYLQSVGDTEIAGHSQGYFKTGPGQYGEGDVFLGIRVPVLRKMVPKFRPTNFDDIINLLHSEFHEARLLALLLLVDRFQRSDQDIQKRVFEAYLDNTKYINNWDLVDSSAHKIVGAYLRDKPREILFELAESALLWNRRIAIISTFWFIKDNDFSDALGLATLLRNDKHDLMHKAVGWVLREVGNKDKATEVAFLDQHYQHMPRTMLRYAIEKFSPSERQAYLKGTI